MAIVNSPLSTTSDRSDVFIPADNLGFVEWNDEIHKELVDQAAEGLFENYFRRYENGEIPLERMPEIEIALFEGDQAEAKDQAKRNYYSRIFSRMRKVVYERDRGVCQVCLTLVLFNHYEVGHIIDRVAGGLDLPTNLCCMCVTCNRKKDITDTLPEYHNWVIQSRKSDLKLWSMIEGELRDRFKLTIYQIEYD